MSDRQFAGGAEPSGPASTEQRNRFGGSRIPRPTLGMLVLIAQLAGIISNSCAADLSGTWPQWRGPTRDGQAAASPAWPQRVDDATLTNTWHVELGPSYSGPIVAADRVFVTETSGKKTEVVQALSRDDGKVLWTAEWPGAMSVPFFAAANGDWIRATPAFDGESLFVAGMRDVLVCLDAANGKQRWRVDFAERYKTALPSFGFVSSPLVDGDHVYVQAGAAFVKLDKRTGETVWRTLADKGGMNGSAFSSPIKATIAGRTQLVVQTRERLVGVDDESGGELWSQKIEAFRGMNILTPVVFGDAIFTSTYGGKSWLFDLVPSSDAGSPTKSFSLIQRWQNKTQGYMSTPVVIDGHAYLHLRNQRLTCINLASGKEQWTTTPFGKYWSLVAQGRQVLALDERGDLLLIHASPEKFELLGQHHVSDSPTWAHLAVCDNEIFIRDLKKIDRISLERVVRNTAHHNDEPIGPFGTTKPAGWVSAALTCPENERWTRRLMKIAIIGAGISGLTAAYQLSREHEITVFEANDSLGGHTNTVDVELDGERHAIDTGFIVFNDWTYPNFIELLKELGVPSRPTSMSFSVRCDAANLEYNGSSLNGLFAQRRNLLRPGFYRMLADILRFNRESPEIVLSRPATDETRRWLKDHGSTPTTSQCAQPTRLECMAILT